MARSSTLGGPLITGRQTVAGAKARGSAARRGAQAGPGDVPTVRQEPAPDLSISPQQFGSQLGAGTQDLARGIGDIAEAADAFRSRMQKTENAAVSAEYESQTNLLKAQKFEELKNSATDSNDFLTQWQEASTQINAEVRENLSGRYFLNQEGSSKLDLIDINQGESYGLKAVAHENNARVARATNAMNSSLSNIVDAVRLFGPDPEAIAKYTATIGDFEDIFTAEQVEAQLAVGGKAIRKAAREFATRNVDNIVREDPELGEAVINVVEAGGVGIETLPEEAQRVVEAMAGGMVPS